MRRRGLWLVLLAAYICLIYGNSLTPAHVSSQESGFILLHVRALLTALELPAAWLTEHIVRKTAHFAEYAGLGLLLAVNASLQARTRAGAWRLALEGAVLIPLVDETIQLFVSGRSGQVSDVWLDMSGAVCGLLLAAAWRRIRGRRPGTDRRMVRAR